MSMLFLSFLHVILSATAEMPGSQVASFTDAKVPGVLAKLPVSDCPSVPGTYGQGIKPAQAVTISGLNLNQQECLIEVWVKPDWSGSDGKKHRLWATENVGGRQLVVEKSEKGMLRAELTTPNGMTVARADVSSWKPGKWHHLGICWRSNLGKNVGLAIWLDKWAVDGPITPYGVFEPGQMPTKILLGDSTSQASFDEFVVRNDFNGEGRSGVKACVYRDYFRTAPYSAVSIDLEPTRVASDRRAVAGFEKVFGLQGKLDGILEPLVENVVRYDQWANFDAKPLIKWSTSDKSIATIDNNGRLKAIKPGSIKVTAKFRNYEAEYPLTVISPNKPDLCAINIELYPRYRSDAAKDRITPGEMVEAKVRLGNFGLVPLQPGSTVKFSLYPTGKQAYRFDGSLKPRQTWEVKLDKPLATGEETTVSFKFPYPAEPNWMKVDLDPENKLDEFCEANNSITDRTDARPVHMGYRPKDVKAAWSDKHINHMGSLSYYDWIKGEKLRMDVMLQQAVYPTTTPNGVEEAYRIDQMTPLEGLKNWDDEPYNKEGVWYDGGFPVNEPIDLMAIDCAIIHEFGHCILSQPDLYGYPITANNVFITDGNGKPIAGTPEFPITEGTNTAPAPPAINVPCYVGYASLMDGCQLWLHPSQAGHIMYYKGYRPDRFWGTQGRLMPTRADWLIIKDAYDNPLKNAAVAVYHVSQAPVQDSGAKYFADRPKFIGQTDAEGRFVFPGETDADWDDPMTDELDGAKPVWNPFGTPESETAFTPNVWEVEGLMLVKIVSGKKVEYQFMDMTQFNTEFLSGNTVCGKFTVKTSLLSSATPTDIVRKPVPDAVKKINKRPVAVAPAELTVKCGEQFTVDGSKSYDPEGQPLIYRWNVGEGWLRGSLSQGATLTLTAPNEPKELEYKLWVNDGVRCSEAVTIKVKVVR